MVINKDKAGIIYSERRISVSLVCDKIGCKENRNNKKPHTIIAIPNQNKILFNCLLFPIISLPIIIILSFSLKILLLKHNVFDLQYTNIQKS